MRTIEEIAQMESDLEWMSSYGWSLKYKCSPSEFNELKREAIKMQVRHQMTRKKTWGDIFRCALARGEDHGYAAWLADLWEKRNGR